MALFNLGAKGLTGLEQNSKLVILQADVANADVSANTLADVTGLSFPLVLGKQYWVKVLINFTTPASTTGSRWTVSTPNCTRLALREDISLGTATSTLVPRITDDGAPASATATSTSAVANKNTAPGGVVFMEGLVIPAADGTFQVQFASAVSASAVTAKAGSYIEYTEIE
jgi:hypothetical protein